MARNLTLLNMRDMLALITDAGLQRKFIKLYAPTYSYDDNGSLTNTVYSDGTPTISLAYNRAGRQVRAHDAAGVTTFLYDDFGALTNETVVGVAGTNEIERFYDIFGRDAGYALNGVRQSTIAYDPATGRLASMFAAGSDTPFTWNYLAGSDLKSSLAYPNGLVASWQYDANNQLLQVSNAFPTNTISQYDYVYDVAGRRINVSKTGTAFDQGDTIAYGYNEKSELTNAVASVDSDYRYSYDFDGIGNREASSERGTNAVYAANSLNQYMAITDVVATPSSSQKFTPQFDDDGNQTLVKTATGIWSVTYNGENRPIQWSNGSTNIVMSFDRMGRRVIKNNQRFVYDGFLQIANFELQISNIKHQTFIWDPNEPVATRPLVWNRGVSAVYYTHDGNKNVSEVVAQNGDIEAHYEYAPFGAILGLRGKSATDNPWRFSSEYAENTLAIAYYNYRHYDPVMGRWLSRDPVEGINLYVCSDNTADMDWLGLIKFDKSCGEIEDYCRNDLEAIIAELDKIKDKYVMPKFQKRKNESTKDERERYQEWRREHQMDPLWKAILEIYKKRGLLGKDNTPIKGIWGSAEDVRKALKDIARELKSKNEPEVVCCPKGLTGKDLCEDETTSGGYVPQESRSLFDQKYLGKIVVCPAMMGKANMIARNGGCGCFLMHELMHRRGMKIPRDKTRGKYERPIENAMIEIQQLILKDLSDRTCKGYDVK